MASPRRRIHGGLILASGLLGVSLTVLILGASRGQATNAGLPGSAAVDFSLRDSAGVAHRLGELRTKPVVLVIANQNAGDFARPAAEINQVCDTFAKDDSVRVLGVQIATDAGLLADSVRTPGALDTHCPRLATLQDPDGTVARAYRVVETPTAFVIDDHGVVRARIALDHDGAAVAIAGSVSSLRAGQLSLDAFKIR